MEKISNQKKRGRINVDSVKLKGVDIVHNLNKYHNHLRKIQLIIYADNVLEHLKDIISPLEEIYRILKNKKKAKIIAPVWPRNRVFKDLTHKVVYTNRTFNYFSKKLFMELLYQSKIQNK